MIDSVSPEMDEKIGKYFRKETRAIQRFILDQYGQLSISTGLIDQYKSYSELPTEYKLKVKMARLKLPMVKPCSSNSEFPCAPCLEKHMNDRLCNFIEPIRDRNKAWRMLSARKMIDGDVELEDVDNGNVLLELKKEDSGDQLYIMKGTCALSRRHLLFRKSALISDSSCIVSVWGIGIYGRVFMEGASNPRSLIIECYLISCSRKIFLKLTMNMLKQILADEDDLLIPGNKHKLVNQLCNRLYFDYSMRGGDGDAVLSICHLVSVNEVTKRRIERNKLKIPVKHKITTIKRLKGLVTSWGRRTNGRHVIFSIFHDDDDDVSRNLKIECYVLSCGAKYKYNISLVRLIQLSGLSCVVDSRYMSDAELFKICDLCKRRITLVDKRQGTNELAIQVDDNVGIGNVMINHKSMVVDQDENDDVGIEKLHCHTRKVKMIDEQDDHICNIATCLVKIDDELAYLSMIKKSDVFDRIYFHVSFLASKTIHRLCLTLWDVRRLINKKFKSYSADYYSLSILVAKRLHVNVMDLVVMLKSIAGKCQLVVSMPELQSDDPDEIVGFALIVYHQALQVSDGLLMKDLNEEEINLIRVYSIELCKFIGHHLKKMKLNPALPMTVLTCVEWNKVEVMDESLDGNHYNPPETSLDILKYLHQVSNSSRSVTKKQETDVAWDLGDDDDDDEKQDEVIEQPTDDDDDEDDEEEEEELISYVAVTCLVYRASHKILAIHPFQHYAYATISIVQKSFNIEIQALVIKQESNKKKKNKVLCCVPPRGIQIQTLMSIEEISNEREIQVMFSMFLSDFALIRQGRKQELIYLTDEDRVKYSVDVELS